MDGAEMQALVSRHMSAEERGDIDGAVAVCTDDIEHDVVGFPVSPRHGKDGAREFYEYLTANFRTEGWEVLHRFFTTDAMVLEQAMTGTVIGSMLGFQETAVASPFACCTSSFRDGLISRENIWLDSAAIIEQLS